MARHGVDGVSEIAEGDCSRPVNRSSSGYRNVFGEPEEGELYEGPADDPKGPRGMYAWLAERMVSSNTTDNPRIPAGYTYLAQLAIHDSVQSLAALPDQQKPRAWRRNSRSGRLLLDTIYGGGPAAEPLAYAVEDRRSMQRGRLRLSRIPEPKPGVAPSPKVGTFRDLPRTGLCPHLNDKGHLQQREEIEKLGMPEVLIADPRNDDNVILSQLTVLFHLLHNSLYDQIVKKAEQDDRYPDRHQDRFLLARKVVTLVYRRIVFEDLLRRLLHPAVYRWYSSRWTRPDGFSDNTTDERMPLEFSHGAARLGHAMVRGTYKINTELDRQGLSRILGHTSLGKPREMPLQSNWLVDWSFLFETGEAAAQSPLQFSRKIGPGFAQEFHESWTDGRIESLIFRDPIESLIFRDLVRGAEAGLRSVQSIVDGIPQELRMHSPLVADDGSIVTGPIIDWLTEQLGRAPNGEETAYLAHIRNSPPLLLFLLVEAAETEFSGQDASGQAVGVEPGECIGAIGSTLLAEFFFRERQRTHALIEGDDGLRELSRDLFGDNIPEDMPGLIAELARRQEWTTPDHQFFLSTESSTKEVPNVERRETREDPAGEAQVRRREDGEVGVGRGTEAKVH